MSAPGQPIPSAAQAAPAPRGPQASLRKTAGRPAERATGAMTLELASLGDVSGFEAQWRDLADRAAEPNPFFRSDFLLPITAYLQPNDPRLLLVRSSGHLTGLLPLVGDRVGFGLSGRHRSVFQHQYGPVGVPLIDRDCVDETLSALFSRARGLPRGLIMHLDENGPVCRALRRLSAENHLPQTVLARHERAAFDAGQNSEHFFKHALVRKKRKDLARLMRRMGELGSVHSFTHKNASAIAGAFERFIALEARGWKGRRETALGSHSERTRFAVNLVGNFAADGLVRIDEITVDGALTASLISFVDGDRLFTWKIAYHEDFARFSPGSQIILALSEALLADPSVAAADSLAQPNHPMIDHLWRERLSIVKAYIPLRPQTPLPAVCMLAEERLHQAASRAAKRLLAAVKARPHKNR